MTIGFVPTMGALHEGHIQLIKQSVVENDTTVCSIYVNPTQFNNSEDLAHYPRNIEGDLDVLRKAGCNLVFLPSDQLMYPEGSLLGMNFGYLENILEGKFRPGHFQGVGLVVSKLFNIIMPHNAYFGRKDLQQFAIIKQMVKELFFAINLHCVDTVRAEDGLALSSRNLRLSSEERLKAPLIYQVLSKAAENLKAGMAIDDTIHDAVQKLENANCFHLEYFDVVNSDSMLSIRNISSEISCSICTALWLGKVRLIDNIQVF